MGFLNDIISTIKRSQAEKKAKLEKELISLLETDSEFLTSLRSEYRHHRSLDRFDKILFFKLYEVGNQKQDDFLLEKISVPHITWYFFEKLRSEEQSELDRLASSAKNGRPVKATTRARREVEDFNDDDLKKRADYWGKL